MNTSVKKADERDLLHVLPLSTVPISTPGLKHASIRKNGRLESVVELFDYKGSGRGHLLVDDLPNEFDWADTSGMSDFGIIKKLSEMPSYDVYSLRIELRKNGISVEDDKFLRLSDNKMEELSTYMTRFTRPLIEEVFGKGGPSDSYEQVIAALKRPDTKESVSRLKEMAKKLNIELLDIPMFLEEFSDIYLSLSYYRQCLDDIIPSYHLLLEALDRIMSDERLQQDRGLMAACAAIKTAITKQMVGAVGMVESFSNNTAGIWTDLSAKKFENIKRMIQSYHASIGGILCMLTVKISAWDNRFPNADVGGPSQRAEFVLSELRQDIEKITEYEIVSPMLSDAA